MSRRTTAASPAMFRAVSQPPHFREINALVETIGKATGLPASDIIAAFEAGTAGIDFIVDEDGKRMIAVRIGDKTALIGAPAEQP